MSCQKLLSLYEKSRTLKYGIKGNLFLLFRLTVPSEVICHNVKPFSKRIAAHNNRYSVMDLRTEVGQSSASRVKEYCA